VRVNSPWGHLYDQTDLRTLGLWQVLALELGASSPLWKLSVFLTVLLRVCIIEPIMSPGETGEQWRERVLQANLMMTLTVKPFPVRLRRRARAVLPFPVERVTVTQLTFSAEALDLY